MKPNNSNPLEAQIQSWEPRRPSPGLRRKIFGKHAEAAPAFHWRRWGWLAPAAGLCMVIVQLAMFRPVTGLSGTGFSPETFTASSLSHQEVTAYAPGWFHSDRNGLIRDTFEWTNGTAALSTVRSLPVMLSLTNSLFD